MAFLSHPNFEQVFTAVSEILDRQHLDLHEDDRKMLTDAHKLMVEAREGVASEGLIQLANDVYANDELEIDGEGVGTSPSDEGTWVQAWVWLSRDQLIEAGLEEPDWKCDNCGNTDQDGSDTCVDCGQTNEEDGDAEAEKID